MSGEWLSRTVGVISRPGLYEFGPCSGSQQQPQWLGDHCLMGLNPSGEIRPVPAAVYMPRGS